MEKERLYKGEGVGGREGRIGGRKERLFTEFHFYYSVNKKKRIKAILDVSLTSSRTPRSMFAAELRCVLLMCTRMEFTQTRTKFCFIGKKDRKSGRGKGRGTGIVAVKG